MHYKQRNLLTKSMLFFLQLNTYMIKGTNLIKSYLLEQGVLRNSLLFWIERLGEKSEHMIKFTEIVVMIF